MRVPNGIGCVPVAFSSSGNPATISVLPSGDILVTGTAFDQTTWTDEGWLTEYKADGTLDTTFGTQGVAILPLNVWGNAQDMTLLANGEVLTGGTLMLSNGETYMFLAKYQVSGSPTSYSSAPQTIYYTYDVRNKLVKVANGNSVEATYGYDDAGNRVSETVGGAKTLYLTDTQNPTGYAQPIEARNATTGAPIMTWILGDRVLGQADANGTMTYLLADGHGSTRLLTSSTGVVTAAFNYDAFGSAINFNAGMAATPFLFGGDSMYDPASGLNMHGDGTRDRLGFEFIQSDPTSGNMSDPISLHKYLYANANPINGSDPTGYMDLGELIVSAGISAVLGAIVGAGVGGTVGGALHLLQYHSFTGIGQSIENGAFYGAIQGALIGGAGAVGPTLLAFTLGGVLGWNVSQAIPVLMNAKIRPETKVAIVVLLALQARFSVAALRGLPVGEAPATPTADVGISARAAFDTVAKGDQALIGWIDPNGKVGFADTSPSMPGHLAAQAAGIIPKGSVGFSVVVDQTGQVVMLYGKSELNANMPDLSIPAAAPNAARPLLLQ